MGNHASTPQQLGLSDVLQFPTLHLSAGTDFQFRDPERGFDRARVTGVVARLVRVKDAAAATALEVAAGGKLYQVGTFCMPSRTDALVRCKRLGALMCCLLLFCSADSGCSLLQTVVLGYGQDTSSSLTARVTVLPNPCAMPLHHQVVVDSEATAKALLSKGQLRNRVTIIPLNKVSPLPWPCLNQPHLGGTSCSRPEF